MRVTGLSLPDPGKTVASGNEHRLDHRAVRDGCQGSAVLVQPEAVGDQAGGVDPPGPQGAESPGRS